MEDIYIFDNTIVNYLLLIKNSYEKFLNKNIECVDNINYINKEKPYNSEIPLDVKILLNNNNISNINKNIQEINILLKNQVEKVDELLNKYCDHKYVKDTIEKKNEVLVDVEYCASCYLNKE